MKSMFLLLFPPKTDRKVGEFFRENVLKEMIFNGCNIYLARRPYMFLDVGMC